MAPGPFITVVSGLPRSGTSLMMQMLEAGGIPALADGARAADHDNPRGYYEFELVKRSRQDTSWLRDAPARAVKLVHLLLMELPAEYAYRVLLMRRHMDEVLASQQAMLRRQQRQGADLAPAQLARVFEAQLHRVEQWLATQANIALLHVDYNQLLEDPAPHIARINAFLGGGLDELAMRRAIDPALYRQRRR